MNKTELIKKIREEEKSISLKDAQKVIDAALIIMSKELKNGNHISLKDFGKFETKIRNSRIGRNPQTGETIRIPEKKVVKFTPFLNILNMEWL